MSLETTPDFESLASSSDETLKFNEKDANALLKGLIEASEPSENTQRQKMEDGFRKLSIDELKNYIQGVGLRDAQKMEFRLAAEKILAEKIQAEKEKPKKSSAEHDGLQGVEAPSAKRSGKRMKADKAVAAEFDVDVITAGGNEAPDLEYEVTPPTQKEQVETSPQSIDLADIINEINSAKYDIKNLSPTEMISYTAGRLVANILKNNARPKERSNRTEEENEQQKLKRQMEDAAFETANDVEREFNRINAKADRISLYAQSQVTGNDNAETDDTVIRFGNEVAAHLKQGATPNEAYSRMIINRIAQKLDNSLSMTLGRHLR